jgi:hypothetical protein
MSDNYMIELTKRELDMITTHIGGAGMRAAEFLNIPTLGDFTRVAVKVEQEDIERLLGKINAARGLPEPETAI